MNDPLSPLTSLKPMSSSERASGHRRHHSTELSEVLDHHQCRHQQTQTQTQAQGRTGKVKVISVCLDTTD